MKSLIGKKKMKVNIGGYPTDWLRCQIHTRYMNKKYGYDWPDVDDFTKFEHRLESLESFIQKIYNTTINKVLRYRKRKVYVRIDPEDVWSMDHTLALIILPMLKQLKSSKHGAPFVDDKDVPKHLRSTQAAPKKNEWDTDDLHFKRWDWVLDEMIHSFECTVYDDWESQFHTGKSDIQFVKEGKLYKMERGPNDTHKFNKKAYQAAWKRRRHGLYLFGKYYHALWD